MSFIDSHSHLYLEEFSQDLPEVINRAKSVGVSHVLLPNIDSSTIDSMLEVCDLYEGYCYPMIGLHPTSVKSDYLDELRIVEQCLASSDKYIAVGEVGLDLYWDKTFISQQLDAFDRQVQLALKHHLPLVIHTRDAFAEMYKAMLPYKDVPLKGVFHSFTGNAEEAGMLLEFDKFMLGVNGVVTFKNSDLWQTLKEVPIDRILIETDAPYLTPAPNRGKRNESAYLKYTLMRVADIYGQTPENVARMTKENTLRVFDRLIS